MSIYTINANSEVKINFAPASVVEEVIQNVRTIMTTIKWQIPLARDLGISGDVVDMPILQAKAKLTQEIIQAVKRYEPRAQIQKIDFEADVTGKLTPKVEVRIIENS